MEPRERLTDARLYLCTDARRERGDLIDFIDAAVRGGVDIVQLRDKGSVGEQQFGVLEAAAELDLLAAIGEVTRRHGALLAVNDRADIAAASGADVLHLGQDDLPPAAARTIVGPGVVIGRSTHDPDQAHAADADPDLDYFCTGPVWATPTKPGRPAAGLELVRSSSARPNRLPWFAIGGIDDQRLPEVLAAGARRIVVVRAITAAADPESAAAALRRAVVSAVRTA
ncbi:thiamine phosphate synthase [Williamsia sp. CHRR-6]|uniref:thiamine phosphate synthase n=1 Tax=Williamsia sp. CHRR-6 TaxID=2835871 RepID=UPI001BD9B6D4|nr:thiamine phosphate synthase [Williamsia sp. CHRR-6]MBT0567046.1 thiamine phosphate synthase [Williamsia sp. CHRR-6]